ncbi:hypothetical protein M405DRAFT_839444 [Rhizopogon salebrosus TDB-379]|nr:hypothetical protein M405DRAFT_839444 [Rhizopogon salebrosus TDB-379]
MNPHENAAPSCMISSMLYRFITMQPPTGSGTFELLRDAGQAFAQATLERDERTDSGLGTDLEDHFHPVPSFSSDRMGSGVPVSFSNCVTLKVITRSRSWRMSLCDDYPAKLAFSETSEIVEKYNDVIGDINDKPVQIDPQDTHPNGYVLDDAHYH